jgi:hypothetical protein
LHFSLEAAEGTFDRFAFLNLDFSQTLIHPLPVNVRSRTPAERHVAGWSKRAFYLSKLNFVNDQIRHLKLVRGRREAPDAHEDS